MLYGKVAFVTAMVLEIIIRFPYREGAHRGGSDPQEQVLLGLLSLGGMIIPLVYVLSGWLAFANYSPSPWLYGIGTVVMVVMLWMFWRSHADLGRNWSSSLDVREDHVLVTKGIYRRIRHPMYAAGWLMVIGQAFLLPNWVAGFSGLVVFALLYFLRVPKEEQLMLEEFGDRYERYMSETGRVIPTIRDSQQGGRNHD